MEHERSVKEKGRKEVMDSPGLILPCSPLRLWEEYEETDEEMEDETED